ncbi:prefolding complex chaperone subunit KNAG_0C02320 [Huiozyma naganishii CBS 8797]|uniref:Prefoldin subunit 1 n=1 Tax=Huiozyma naganishii (strain ATCC MYA-139 / BCRC 22969 / CBS 8797 / KCTC 17520 / NBRC 10181 / NCYC 3082 / Yp74L-3) TaxID=1071383 RepID=J7RII9_HUIN7|nr:hypothetical protein KNAG_0C02320 [Kazachstania naganishii CBS 8797]CCK69343.1 hypothetical protein KNAG_0C02320 [Kazachstania naganishii CBS 8797]
MTTPQLMQEMTASLRSYKVQLDTVNQQLFHIERQDKLAAVTAKELNSYPTDHVWRSCGRAFILQEKDKYVADLSSGEAALKEQMKNLKIKQNYLETSVEKTVGNLKKVLGKNGE